MQKSVIVAALSLTAASAASAQAGQRETKLVGIDGKCVKLGYRTVDLTQDCKGSLLNSAHSDGTTGFLLMAADTMISFVGDGRRQAQRDSSQTFSPVDSVAFTLNGSTNRIAVVGWCEFSDPYKRQLVAIRCLA